MISKPGKLSGFGIAAIASFFIFPIPGLVLFALLASIIEENKLESGGSLSFLGTSAVFSPIIIGIVLILFDLLASEVLKQKLFNFVAKISLAKILLFLGLITLIPGILGVLFNNQGGANIGAGILLMSSLSFLILGAVFHFKNSQNH